MHQPNPPFLISYEELPKMYGVGKAFWDELIDLGDIPFICFGKIVLVDTRDVESWLFEMKYPSFNRGIAVTSET